jgi:hypothetical protein
MRFGSSLVVLALLASCPLPETNFSQWPGFAEYFAQRPPSVTLPSEQERVLLERHRPRFFLPPAHAGMIDFYGDYVARGELRQNGQLARLRQGPGSGVRGGAATGRRAAARLKLISRRTCLESQYPRAFPDDPPGDQHRIIAWLAFASRPSVKGSQPLIAERHRQRHGTQAARGDTFEQDGQHFEYHRRRGAAL